MSYFEIEYRKRYCYEGRKDHCNDCHTDYAEEVGCSCYEADEPEVCDWRCKYAIDETAYAGFSTKSYETERYRDMFDPTGYDLMDLRTRKKTYECYKIVKDGETIYDYYSELGE